MRTVLERASAVLLAAISAVVLYTACSIHFSNADAQGRDPPIVRIVRSVAAR